jgi:glutamate synthase domain-containing protein 3
MLDFDANQVDQDQWVEHIQEWSEEQWRQFVSQNALTKVDRTKAIERLTFALDRIYPTSNLRRSSLVALISKGLTTMFQSIVENPDPDFAGLIQGSPIPSPEHPNQALVLDASTFKTEGEDSLAFAMQDSLRSGYKRLIVFGCRGHRFIGNGLGPDSEGVQIDVYGSAGDYLGSGLDGATIVVHADGQDQLAQIMKSGKLIVHGDVGQTFMYAAKGGQVFVRGNAAGRPLINAVGKPRVVINGTCLDYLAESFMAGDPLDGGGFVVLNGVHFDRDGVLMPLETPYPGGNLFSLASGGAIFLRDPKRVVGEDQLNGGVFVPFSEAHWALIQPLLDENERLFGIPVAWLLTVDGRLRSPGEVYRAIVPAHNTALQPEQAWVNHE